MNSESKKLWPDAVALLVFEGFNFTPEPETETVEEIMSLGKSMGREVADDDINDLSKEIEEDLLTEGLY